LTETTKKLEIFFYRYWHNRLYQTAQIDDWILVRGSQPGPLFYHINKSDRIYQRRLTDSTVRHMLVKLDKIAGIQSFSAHDLRRSFISDLLDKGADIATAQKLAGHASVETTARYDRRGEVTKRNAAGLLHVPYSSPRRTTLPE
jgi:integrase/recombinase XerD